MANRSKSILILNYWVLCSSPLTHDYCFRLESSDLVKIIFFPTVSAFWNDQSWSLWVFRAWSRPHFRSNIY